MSIERTHWPYATKLVTSLLLLAFFLYLLSRFRIVIPPLILAAILAYILNPLVNRLQVSLRLPRPLAILVSYILFIGVSITLPVLIVPILANQLTDLNLDMQLIRQQVESLLGGKYLIGGFTVDAGAVFEQALVALQGLMEPIISQTLGLMVDFITSLVWLIFILVVAFYLIKDGASLRDWFENHLPPAFRDDILLLRDDINQIWAAFFRGQIALALIVSIIFTVAGFLLGLPFALAMAILAGLMEFLPSVGHAIWIAIASVLAFFLGSTWIPLPNWAFMLLVIGLHLFFEQFDLNYLIPRVIGRRVHLPPLVVILGIVTGAVLAGVLGIPLAAPTIASARVLGRYVYANLFDMEPFPHSAASPLPPPDLRWWQHSRKEKKI